MSKKISELGLASTLVGTEIIPIVQAGENFKVPLDTVGDFFMSVPAPTFSQVFASAHYASETKSAVVAVDLKTKRGAWVYAQMGRRVSNALNRSSYLAIVPSCNASSSIRFPATEQNLESTIATCDATTLSAGSSIGDTSITVADANGFAVGDAVCFSSPDTNGNRVEWARIFTINGTTITFEQPLLLAHNSGDTLSSDADIFGRTWIDGGDIYHLFVVNPSNRAVLWNVQIAEQP